MSCAQIKELLIDQISERWLCRPTRNGEGQCVLVTDLLLPNNDCVELMIEDTGSGEFRVHDRALSYNFLRSSGINLESNSQRNRNEQVEGFTAQFNTSFENRHIQRHVDRGELWKGVVLVYETAKAVCGLIESRQAKSTSSFKDRVYGYFKRMRTRVERNYQVDGYTKTNRFDLRLNGTESVLCRTISQKTSSQVQSRIERAWFAFDDVAREGHQYDHAIIYDDTEEDRRTAWTRDHFRILRKREIPAYGFDSNLDQLRELATQHQN